ncbi:MAG: DNA polymerase III subunit gamma/tau [Bacteroidales bacterium]|nr:DNA polymerase III subunit gamma/tau [Bacteroidales bacterium]
MENFVVSARKYRPDTFHSVVGQASITTTLKNAIQRNQLAHAYLFCGPRGVGKTTCARIFAKTINCMHQTAEFEACNECESCTSFNSNRSYNIHELDAASNNSVDGIRKLIDMVRVPPQMGRYNVYIIDEVHMLSQSAFNAFLKTLEEPPAHAIFIMATTEKHKILPTILSRCQIFDFNRIRVDDTVQYLQYIAKQEGVEAEPEALNIIAQKADGAMRDALSIFDQVVSFSNHEITYAKTIEHLNVLDRQIYFQLTEHFLNSRLGESLRLFDQLLSKGFDAQQFITGLSLHLRNLLVGKDPQTLELLEVGAAFASRYKEMGEKCPYDFLVQALMICNRFDANFRQSPNQRLHVELLLIKLSELTQELEKKKIAQPR